MTSLSGLYTVDTNAVSDNRGAFLRCFCEPSLTTLLNERRILQINKSVTHAVGTVRGLHFQNPPYCEMKFIRCIRGKVWDVVVDLRQGSRTFLHWHAETLSEENNRMLVVPEGFAHGFQVLEQSSELLYLHTAIYEPTHEGGVRFDDPRIGITWPLQIQEISLRDQSHALLDAKFEGITL